MAKKSNKLNKTIAKLLWIGAGLAVLTPLFILLLINLGAFGELPPTTKLENPNTPLATEIISSDGELIGKYYNENRSPVDYEDLSPNLVNALIATEDVRYFEHSGIDFRALMRVMFKTVVLQQRSSGGGSTLTQQLAKLLFHERPQSLVKRTVQKLKEWVIATRLERLYTKEEILTMYLNEADFGSNAKGIKSAADTYFKKKPSELDTIEAAVLVGMLQAPTRFNPHRNPNNSKERRNTVLAQMTKYDYITEEQFERLIEQPTVLKYNVETHNEGTATYFREYLRLWVKNWADKKGYDIYSDGLRVYTTIDSRMQRYAEDAAYEHLKDMQKLFFQQYKTTKPWSQVPEIIDLTVKRSERYRAMKADKATEDEITKAFNRPREMSVFTYQGAKDTVMSPLDSIKYYKYYLHTGFMAMEPNTGHIKVWVGGINYKYFKYDHVNKRAKRQVGSTFKPLVYATAITNGYSPCLKVPNVPVVFENYENWSPRNSDGKYGGTMTLRKGLATSTNCVTAWVMKEVGINPVVQLGQKMGITSNLEPVPSLCLGVADISVYEMVGAFNTFNNLGEYVEPVFVTRIEDKNGNILQEFVPRTVDVMDEKKAYIMVDMLKSVANCGLAGTACRLRYKHKHYNPMGGKTGTTQNNSDGWFMGIIPQLTGGIWVGAEDRAVHFNRMEHGQGASLALPIWGNFLTKVYEDKSLGIEREIDWEKPPGDLGVEMDCSKYEEETTDPGLDIFGTGGIL